MEGLHWYALKIFYNKVFEFEDLLGGMGFETYLPVQRVQLRGEEHLRVARRLAILDDGRADNQYIQAGPVIFKRQPVVTSLLFARADQEGIQTIRKALEGKGFVYMTPDWKQPAVIPEKQMAMFRMVTSSGVEGLEFFSDEDMTRYKKGDKVRVTEGPLKGTEGYIRRIRKDRRLLVAIEGFIAVATSYIPPQFLEKVQE
ncbi:MAG: UpxY family transcription antiterminator [Bacteroidales bacterium]|nr:UpxY family transcription antiterminator [Bacteroidales bacterium]